MDVVIIIESLVEELKNFNNAESIPWLKSVFRKANTVYIIKIQPTSLADNKLVYKGNNKKEIARSPIKPTL